MQVLKRWRIRYINSRAFAIFLSSLGRLELVDLHTQSTFPPAQVDDFVHVCMSSEWGVVVDVAATIEGLLQPHKHLGARLMLATVDSYLEVPCKPCMAFFCCEA